MESKYNEIIPGVLVRKLKKHEDSRGWLIEAFREDELPEGFRPVMAYISSTHPGVVRGPHEHKEQTDGFVFLSGKFLLCLWENRPGYSPCELRIEVGEEAPMFVIVPPGVVHAYQNIGEKEAWILNMPNTLYGGWGRQNPVDEIRHEENPDSPFRV